MKIQGRYIDFRRGLPRPPLHLDQKTIDILHPKKKPSLDEHGRDLRELQEWALLPASFPNSFSNDLLDSRTEVGRWAAACLLRWRARYDLEIKRYKRYEDLTKGLLTGSLVATLGAFGLDGVIEGIEWGIPGSVLGGRVFAPFSIARYRDKAETNLTLIDDIIGKQQ